MEYEKPEEFLEKTRAIFAEREQEFQLRQQAFEEKERNLNMLLQRIASEKKALEEQQREMKMNQAALEKERTALQEQSVKMDEQESAIKKRETDLAEQEKNHLLKYNLELEQVRNSEMKLQRLVEEYNYKISLLDPGIAEILEGSLSVSDIENYIPIEEHKHKVRIAEEKIQNLIGEQEELKAIIAEMQEERGKLINKIVELSSSQTDERCESEDKGKMKQSDDEDVKMDEDEIKSGSVEKEITEPISEAEEELTASVLQSYLKKNRSDFNPLEIRHSEDGELLYAESRGLTYHFLFVEPSTFDISVERKNSSRLRKQLESFNEKFPGVQFRYDEAERKVYATGYFTNQLKAYELMRRVQEIADCFRQE